MQQKREEKKEERNVAATSKFKHCMIRRSRSTEKVKSGCYVARVLKIGKTGLNPQLLLAVLRRYFRRGSICFMFGAVHFLNS